MAAAEITVNTGMAFFKKRHTIKIAENIIAAEKIKADGSIFSPFTASHSLIFRFMPARLNIDFFCAELLLPVPACALSCAVFCRLCREP